MYTEDPKELRQKLTYINRVNPKLNVVVVKLRKLICNIENVVKLTSIYTKLVFLILYSSFYIITVFFIKDSID